MNRCKKISIVAGILLTALNIVACGQVKEDDVVNTDESAASRQESNVHTVESTDSETIDVEESNAQANENIDSEMTTEELLDLFINGSISAISSTDSTSTFYITDLNMDSEEWDSYSIGEKVDLDNDGENELIIRGPYGGIYLDARDNKVYEFAAGNGNALTLSYVVYSGATWVMYSNRMHTGYESYHMELFEGADNLVAEMNFNEELVDEDNAEGEVKYTWNGTEISYDEYYALCSKIFAAEVNTEESAINEQANDKQTFEETANDILGYYVCPIDDSTLSITSAVDGSYNAELNLVRLTSIDDFMGKYENGIVTMIGTDSAGNPIAVEISFSNEQATLTFTDSTWEYLENGRQYVFNKK